jgi:hypothetical protein
MRYINSNHHHHHHHNNNNNITIDHRLKKSKEDKMMTTTAINSNNNDDDDASGPTTAANSAAGTASIRSCSSSSAALSSCPFNEDEILNRFKVISHDIGDKVISLSEDVLLTCNNWCDPKSNVRKLEEAISDPRKKHLVFYDMWHDDIVNEILCLFRKYNNRYWSSIEFRGCQEKHINAVLESALEMDIVQTIAFSLTNDRYDPRRRCKNTTFDIIARSMASNNNTRLECLIFHSRPIHFIQYESLKNLKVKRLHFLEGIFVHPDEIPELAAGLQANKSLISFSFLGGTQVSNGNDISKIVHALISHPSLKRLLLCLKSSSEHGVAGLTELLSCQNNSALESLALTGGFTLSSFFPEGTLSKGLTKSRLKHLHLRDVFLFPHDVDDMAIGLRSNQSIESFSVKLDASNMTVDIAPIAFAFQDNERIQRLALAGKCSLGYGVYGIAKLLSSKKSKLKDLHLSGAFLDKELRIDNYLQIFTAGLKGNCTLESLDLSVNGLSDRDVSMIYKVIPTCRKLDNLDLGMNDITSHAIESFANVKKPNQLGILRISSPKFSFFEINDQLCHTLIKLLTINPRLGDVNFNMGPIEWHHSYQEENGEMRWHRKSSPIRRNLVFIRNKLKHKYNISSFDFFLFYSPCFAPLLFLRQQTIFNGSQITSHPIYHTVCIPIINASVTSKIKS